MLCSTAIRLQHPTIDNTEVSVDIDTSTRFDAYITRETKRFASYQKWMVREGVSCLLAIQQVWQGMDPYKTDGGRLRD